MILFSKTIAMSGDFFVKKVQAILVSMVLLQGVSTTLLAQAAKKDTNMEWWRDARFGLFIHWGLYAVPAGEWKGNTTHGEWIRQTAEIPLETYDKFLQQFNPVQFDAAAWVRLAKEAGMKYIVITSKHHDGFGLWDSKQTDFDILSTPFQRDILKELAAACKEQDIQLCFYHSIMDWHHPDYLPRRPWEKDRSTAGANFSNYITYMKSQLKELLTNYGKIGIVWFDGEWEPTWTHEMGMDLYKYVKSLQPGIIINNRVDKGRQGMQGLTRAGEYAGDYGTPEQEIPATGVPGVDWESCMTMNNNWGYNSHDNNWKSPEDLVHKLIDIASKGGNFLLNVGPTAEGVFPNASIERLKAIGSWMKNNSESIYGSQASPFKKLPWGRATLKERSGGTTLYLHVFDWPANGKLVVPGLSNEVTDAYILANKKALKGTASAGDYIIDVTGVQKQDYATVIVLDIKGKPVVYTEPDIKAGATLFTNQLPVSFSTTIPGATIRYTVNGSEPVHTSFAATAPVFLNQTATVKAKCFINDKPVSGTAVATFTKVQAAPAQKIKPAGTGLRSSLYEGKWSQLPDFATLKPVVRNNVSNIDISARKGKEDYGYVFEGLIHIPADGVYTFYLLSDDGSRLLIDNKLAIDHDGRHSATEKSLDIPLAKGYHPVKILFFQGTGGDDLQLEWKGPGFEKKPVPDTAWYR
jgi:alpha-L-fucosidase